MRAINQAKYLRAKFGVKFWCENFRVPRFAMFGCPKRKISPKCHAKNGAKNGKFDANSTLLGGGVELRVHFKLNSRAPFEHVPCGTS